MTGDFIVGHSHNLDAKTLHEKLNMYETALQNIASITKVEVPLDRSAEGFFMVASKMRQIAREALKLGAEVSTIIHNLSTDTVIIEHKSEVERLTDEPH